MPDWFQESSFIPRPGVLSDPAVACPCLVTACPCPFWSICVPRDLFLQILEKCWPRASSGWWPRHGCGGFPSSYGTDDELDYHFPDTRWHKLATYPEWLGACCEMKLLGFPDRAILLIRKLHYTIIRGYNRQNPRCDNNLGKLERYRLVTIGGGERDWSLNPHFQWFIFRIPGWHCIAGVLLSVS